MTRDDVIRMAREAGVLSGYESELFQRFAALVAAAERAECVKSASMLANALVLAERENCAKVCDDMERANLYGVKECAAAIRAKGKHD